MTVINTNVASLNAQAALANNARGLSKTMEQLSTGRRINSASDDAAGLAVSTRLTSQIRGLNTAVRNANDGISMIQTAEGAAVEITNMLQRMRELSVQAANDTNTSTDRSFLNLEFGQLRSEIDRIAKTTQWNGMNILDGSFADATTGDSSATYTFQVGANASQTVAVTVDSFAVTKTAGGTISGASVTTAGVTASPTSAQVSTMTLGGTFAEGETVSFDIVQGGTRSTVSFSVGSTTTTSAVITGLNSAAGKPAGYTIAASGSAGAFTITGLSAGTAFTVENAAVGASYTNASDMNNLRNENILSRSAADSAISKIDLALTEINEQRATMGAVVNRLQYTVDNLTNVATKATESRSRVLDTDYSQATTELSKRQIISQAATAMLAQANQQPQTVLSLLK